MDLQYVKCHVLNEMSFEEERRLVLLAQSGDHSATETLFSYCSGIGPWFALRHPILAGTHLNQYSNEDRISSANMGILNAILRHNVNRGTRLSTTIWYWVRKDILNGGPYNQKVRTVSLSRAKDVADDSSIPGGDRTLDVIDGKILADIADNLPEPERTAIQLKFGLNGLQEHSLRESAKKMGIAHTVVKKHVDNGKDLLIRAFVEHKRQLRERNRD